MVRMRVPQSQNMAYIEIVVANEMIQMFTLFSTAASPLAPHSRRNGSTRWILGIHHLDDFRGVFVSVCVFSKLALHE